MGTDKVVIDTSMPSTAESFSQAVFAAENADTLSGFPDLVKEDINGGETGVYEYAFCFLHYNEGWEIIRGTEECLCHEDGVVVSSPVTVSSWTANGSGEYYSSGYVYKADITVPGCKASWTGSIIFGISSAASGKLAPCFETGDGKITVYSKTNASAVIQRIEVRP